jgi:linoleate 10R-lipoxygenase
MEQARRWNCGTLNEFRKFFGLKEYSSFEEINPDPYIAEQLRHLYEHPDYVELYPGIVAEAPKVPMVPGAGICPTYTLSRAILSDAVALVRGDRFYTVSHASTSLHPDLRVTLTSPRSITMPEILQNGDSQKLTTTSPLTRDACSTS